MFYVVGLNGTRICVRDSKDGVDVCEQPYNLLQYLRQSNHEEILGLTLYKGKLLVTGVCTQVNCTQISWSFIKQQIDKCASSSRMSEGGIVALDKFAIALAQCCIDSKIYIFSNGGVGKYRYKKINTDCWAYYINEDGDFKKIRETTNRGTAQSILRTCLKDCKNKYNMSVE